MDADESGRKTATNNNNSTGQICIFTHSSNDGGIVFVKHHMHPCWCYCCLASSVSQPQQVNDRHWRDLRGVDSWHWTLRSINMTPGCRDSANTVLVKVSIQVIGIFGAAIGTANTTAIL